MQYSCSREVALCFFISLTVLKKDLQLGNVQGILEGCSSLVGLVVTGEAGSALGVEGLDMIDLGLLETKKMQRRRRQKVIKQTREMEKREGGL